MPAGWEGGSNSEKNDELVGSQKPSESGRDSKRAEATDAEEDEEERGPYSRNHTAARQTTNSKDAQQRLQERRGFLRTLRSIHFPIPNF